VMVKKKGVDAVLPAEEVWLSGRADRPWEANGPEPHGPGPGQSR
jgi:hypothetical protein